VPYAAIGALILPDGLRAVDDAIVPSTVGMAVAAIVAAFVRKPIIVVLAAVGAVLLMQWVGG
jgi:branched-subunit amino acid transport protein